MIKVCGDLYQTVIEMNKVPNEMFCTYLPPLWQPECELRANGVISVQDPEFSTNELIIILVSLGTVIMTMCICCCCCFAKCCKRDADQIVVNSRRLHPDEVEVSSDNPENGAVNFHPDIRRKSEKMRKKRTYVPLGIPVKQDSNLY